MMASLTIHLFGGLTVVVDGDDRSSLYSGRLRSLLALLLLEQGVSHSRQSIAFTLWPDSSEKQARTNLRKLILLLRTALGPSVRHLVTDSQSICWRGDEHCWLDMIAFTEKLDAAKTSPSTTQAIALYTEAIDLYRGDLLPDCYEEWILAPREQLRDHYINALEQLCVLLEAERRYAEGVAAARRLLQHDPVYERGHLHLVRLQALMNDRAGALQSYHRCATMLRRELGVDPSPAMEELYLQLLDHNLDNLVTVSADTTTATPLVGRRHAWQQLRDSWQHTQTGRAHFTLISGEAGIGKSRLAEEIMLWVGRQGIDVAHARAYSSDNRLLTFAPVVGWLRVPTIRKQVDQLDPKWLTEVARLLPELLLARNDIRPPQPMVDDWQRHHLFAALTHALQPGTHPRLLILDDLQWCDSETLAWLPHLLEGAQKDRLLVIGTVRSEEFDEYEALQAMCDTLRRRGQLNQIPLEPLTPDESAELAEATVGQPLAQQQAQWLIEATEGNPLFVIESAHLIHEDNLQDENIRNSPITLTSHTPFRDAGDASLSKLPQSVLAVIEARLSRLSKEARAVAEVAAAIGRSFTFPILTAATALDEDELVDALDELWRRRIIRERESDAYDFSHDRIRDVAYASVSRTRLRLLHRRIAAAIEQTQRDLRDDLLDEVSGQLGYHYEQARERLTAIDHYMRAARIATRHYAHGDTKQYLLRVLALALPDELSIRFDAHLHLDRMLEQAGTILQWQENVRQLCALAEADLSDPLLAARRRARSAERAACVYTRSQDFALAIVYARQALDAAALTNDLGLHALCHYSLARRIWHVADFPQVIHHLEKAIVLARQIGDSDTLANALEIRAQTYMFNGGKASQIEPLLEESLFHYDKVGSLHGRCQILNKLGYLPFAQGTGIYEGACAHLHEAIAIARQMTSPAAEIHMDRNLSITLTCMGNYAAAEEWLVQAQARYYELGKQEEDSVLLNYGGFLCFNQGRLAAAFDKQQRALSGLTAMSHDQWRVKALTALGWISLRWGHLQQADEYLEVAISECSRINEKRQLAYSLICRGILRTEWGEWVTARSDFEEARTLLHSFQMFNRALEAEVGLAYLDFLEGNHNIALCAALDILAHLEEHPVDFTEDVCQLLLSCNRILSALDCAAAERLGVLVRLHFETRTATLDAATQKLFWQIEAHQELREASALRFHTVSPA